MKPIIIFVDEIITKEKLAKAVSDAYEQGYRDGRATVYSLTGTTTNPYIYYSTSTSSSSSLNNIATPRRSNE